MREQLLLASNQIDGQDQRSTAGADAARLTLSSAATGNSRAIGADQSDNLPADAPASAFGRLVDSWQDSFKFYLVQAPLSGATQIHDHFTGRHLEERSRLFSLRYTSPEAGSAQWYGSIAGNLAATVLQFGALYRFAGPGAAAKFERSAKYGLSAEELAKGAVASTVQVTGLDRLIDPKLAESLNRVTLDTTAAPYLVKSFKAGAIVGGIFTPTSSRDDNFLTNRLLDAGVTGLAFTSATAASLVLKTAGRSFLRSDVVAGSLAGALAGEVNVDGKSIATTGSVATWDQRLESVAAGALGGGLGGGLNTLHEFIVPTNHVRGLRTIEDVTRAADATVVPGNPKPEVLAKLQNKPAKAEEFLETDDAVLSPDQVILKRMRLELPKLGFPVEVAKNIMRDTQSTIEMAKALHSEEAKQITVTGYGGVRVVPNDFDYQSARLFGGLCAHENWAIKTGGGRRPGPEGGSIMEALNKGAAEAGGTSIGVLLSKLSGEQGQTGNSYLTVRRFHPNFPPRKADLRHADYHVLFKGGLGSLDELFDKSVNVQTGKEPEGPIYVVGHELYQHSLQQLEVMAKQGLASKADRDRLVPADDVRWVRDDIKRREAEKQALRQAAADGVAPPQEALEHNWLTNLLRPLAPP